MVHVNIYIYICNNVEIIFFDSHGTHAPGCGDGCSMGGTGTLEKKIIIISRLGYVTLQLIIIVA